MAAIKVFVLSCLERQGGKAADKTNDLQGRPLKIPSRVVGLAYTDARKRLFHLACQAWDERDTSKRPRILKEAEATAA